MYVYPSVCGRVFVHGRMSLDGNKLQKVFQDSISKACCLIMMMSAVLMRVLIDTKQMAGSIAIKQIKQVIKQEFVWNKEM